MDATPSWLQALAQHSETAQRIAAHDWSSTPLGAPGTWPESLQVSVRLCLESDFPMLVAWGPELVMIYNEGYRAMLGRDKHPAAIGRPVREVWAEVWSELAPLFAQVQSTGLAFNAEHLPLQVVRNGYAEEAFFTFCYSPIRVGEAVAGTLDIAMETTSEVVSDRRLGLLGDLAAAMVTARLVVDVTAAAVGAIEGHADVVTADIRVWAHDADEPTEAGQPVDLRPVPDDLRELDGSAAVVLDADWVAGAPADRVALPTGSGASAGVLVLGLNPNRPFDDDHRSFVELVGQIVGAALDSADQRSVEEREQRAISDTLQAAMVPPASDLPGVAARYRPAVGHLSVGGDWYDVIGLPDGRCALVVGDCVGHGLHAATAMGQLRSASRAFLLEGGSPAEVLDAMDRFAAHVPGGDFATMACAVVDVAAGVATYACAGRRTGPARRSPAAVLRWPRGAPG